MKFRTTADLIHDEMIQTRKDQRNAPWERYGAFELKLQDLETKLAMWEERIVDLEDRLIRLDEYCEELFTLEGTCFNLPFIRMHVINYFASQEMKRRNTILLSGQAYC